MRDVIDQYTILSVLEDAFGMQTLLTTQVRKRLVAARAF